LLIDFCSLQVSYISFFFFFFFAMLSDQGCTPDKHFSHQIMYNSTAFACCDSDSNSDHGNRSTVTVLDASYQLAGCVAHEHKFILYQC
jgi:hypothetical protein